MSTPDIQYQYTSAEATHDSSYLTDPVLKLLKKNRMQENRLFELGCGNGYITNQFALAGFDVTAVDTSKSGIKNARKKFTNCRFEVGSAYDDLSATYGSFPTVVSLEVVEHVYSPKLYAKTLYNLVEHNGFALISTPYHGYLKNLAIALLNKFDSHVDPLWEGGHIKFWSKSTLKKLLIDAGFKEVTFINVGRVSWLAMSMIAIARK